MDKKAGDPDQEMNFNSDYKLFCSKMCLVAVERCDGRTGRQTETTSKMAIHLKRRVGNTCNLSPYLP